MSEKKWTEMESELAGQVARIQRNYVLVWRCLRIAFAFLLVTFALMTRL